LHPGLKDRFTPSSKPAFMQDSSSALFEEQMQNPGRARFNQSEDVKLLTFLKDEQALNSRCLGPS